MRFPKKPYVPEDAHSFGVGPLQLDVLMARRHGWTWAAIYRTAKKIGAISRREAAIAHRKGQVQDCPCVVCDQGVRLDELPERYRGARKKMSKHTQRS